LDLTAYRHISTDRVSAFANAQALAPANSAMLHCSSAYSKNGHGHKLAGQKRAIYMVDQNFD